MAIELLQQIVEIPQWAIAAIVSIVVVAFGMFLTKFGKHSEVSISGPVEIRVLQETDKRIEATMSKGFQDLRDLAEAQEGRMHNWKNEILDKLSAATLNEAKLNWRLGTVETELKDVRDKRIAALETELRGLNNTKEKMASLEKELKELNRRERDGGTA